MAAVDQLTPDAYQPEPEFPDPRCLVLRYDAKRDTLLLAQGNPGPALSVDLDNGVWLRYEPESNQVVGIEIEDYSRTFLRTHPALARQWRTARTRRLIGASSRESRMQFKQSLLECARRTFVTRPRQLTMPVMQSEDGSNAIHRDSDS
jgi:hypothetical protein